LCKRKKIHSSEQIIKDVLRPLIDKVRDIGWSDDADPTDAEVLGVILAKFLEWDGRKISEAAHSAFVDANFRPRIEFN